jgi:membrane protein implicated in regulation of membrane protease activity
MDSLYTFYFTVMLIGGGFLLLSFILGEISDVGGGLLHGLDSFLNSFGLDLVSDGGDGGAHDGAANPFNIRNIAAFLAFFGATGVISLGYFDTGSAVSVGISLVAGVFGAWAMWRVTRLIAAQAGSSEARLTDFLGQSARVTVAIPPGGPGTVILTVRGQTQSWAARSESGEAIAAGTTVRVTSREGGTLMVTTEPRAQPESA